MRRFFLLLLITLPLTAQPVTLGLAGTNGVSPFPSTYSFPDTPQGTSSQITVQITNSGTVPMELISVIAATTPGLSNQAPDFSVIGLPLDSTLAPGGSKSFTVSFNPAATGGPFLAYLQAVYMTQGNGCVLGASTQQSGCVASFSSLSTLQGTGTAPAFLVSYISGGVSIPLQSGATSPVDFGLISLSATGSMTFVITNQTSSSISTPSVPQIQGNTAFQVGASSLPASIGPEGAANFTVTFSPGQIGLTQAILVIAGTSYTLQGTGVAVTPDDALQVSYVDQTGVRTEPQAATPISFGQITAGAAGSAVLTFTLANPSTSFDAVSLTALAVSGTGFTLSGAPSLPVSIQPGTSIGFQLSFSPPAGAGKFSGTLTIGSRVFSLSAQSVVSSLPAVSFQLSESPLTSQQQVNLTVQLASPSPQAAIGDLQLQFAPSVANVSDDPAVAFLATNTRELNVTVAQGSQTATYNGQSQIAFQTGTTAGSITLTLTFPNGTPYTQSFTIPPAQIFVSSAQALLQTPNLVLTMNGYDNTYSAGQLSFLFSDTSGKPLTASPVSVDVTSNFKQYFFTNNQAGGAFALQATFPVTAGDPTKVGSVVVTLTNAAGQTTKTLSFQ